jgi:signal transduction histidine kinase/DNA-binding response OmpR family regulator/streptogramin lyase
VHSDGRLWCHIKNSGLYLLDFSDADWEAVRSGDVKGNIKLVGPYQSLDKLTGSSTGMEVCYLESAGNSLLISMGKKLVILETSVDGTFPDPVNSDFETISFTEMDGNDSFHDILVGEEDGVWIGIQSGLIHVEDHTHPNKYAFYPFPLENFSNRMMSNPRSMETDQHGQIWIATFEGVLIFNSGTKTFQHVRYEPANPEGISYPSITKVFVDRGNIVWLGTAGMGLNNFSYERDPFEHFLGRDRVHEIYSVHDLLTDRNNDIWFTASGLLYHLRRKSGNVGAARLPALGEECQIAHMVRDSAGIFWISNLSRLIRYDPETETGTVFPIMERNRRNFYLYDSIHAISTGPLGDIWLCNTRSLRHFKREYGVYESFSLPALPLERVNALHRDDRGAFWIASQNGLLQYHNATGSWRWYNPESGTGGSFPYRHLTSILPDPEKPEQYLWMGTGGDGLVRFDMMNETFKGFTIRDGLPNNFIYGILADDSGKLWMSTNLGLSCYDPVTGDFQNYDQSRGLQSNEFNYRSFYKSPDGEMFFGGINGISAFYPNRITVNPHLPQVVLTGMQLSYEPVEPGTKDSPLTSTINTTRQIRLKHNQRTFAFKFAALEFTDVSKNLFRYMLDGFDERWIEAGTNNMAFYTNIPAGKYMFKVIGSNNDGIFNQEGASLEVIIERHPWVKWYAFLLYISLLILTLYFIHRTLLEKRKANLEIRQKEDETRRLSELDQFKSRFFANISHEFRTPISLIQGYLDDLLEEMKRKDLRQIVFSAKRNSSELLLLIDQLLDLARLESNSLKIQPEILDLVQYLKKLVGEFTSTAQRQGLSLKFHSEQESIIAQFDPGVMQKIFNNLMSNAMKFTPPGGTIRIDIESSGKTDPNRPGCEKGFLCIRVSDTGIGIPEEKIAHIFDRFYQVGEDRKETPKGFGLGLGMVRELTELQGGRVIVESEPGKGSTFTVTIPALQKEDQITEIPASHVITETMADPETEVVNKQDHRFANNALQFTSADSGLILVVEDHAELREYIQLILQKEYDVILASDGREGLLSARKKIPDLIISDIRMPFVDGFDLIQQLMKDELTSHIPVILLTAMAETDSRLRGLELGAEDYLVKPFKKEELLLRIRNILRKRAELQKRYLKMLKGESFREPDSSLDQKFLMNVKRLLDEHLSDETFGVEQFADALHMSPSNLYRKLRALTNLSTMQLIHQTRLEKAIRLLKQGNSIGDVAYQVGFNNLSSFSNFFKKEYGVSPREFMKH